MPLEATSEILQRVPPQPLGDVAAFFFLPATGRLPTDAPGNTQNCHENGNDSNCPKFSSHGNIKRTLTFHVAVSWRHGRRHRYW